MKNLAKRSLALVLALVLCIGILPGLSIPASAAANVVNVEYVTGTASYGGDTFYDVIYNWGERGQTATYLSQNASAFYTGDYTYDELSQLSGDDLYDALYELMYSNHAHVTDYDETRALYAFTDCENSGYYTDAISGFYTGYSIGPAWDGGATWNREHTWPKSKTDAGTCSGSSDGEVADIMMLRPEDSNTNSSRGNKAYGAVTDETHYYPNLSEDYDVRGDIARIYLYVYVRWGNERLLENDVVITSIDLLLEWMEEDPVDTWEMGRNDSVQSVTGTRNVFVDYPELAYLLFEEEIPADMITPSGEGYESNYTVTAVANGNGIVLVNGNTVTYLPDDGYEVLKYSVNGFADVTENGNVLILDAQSDCTVTVNFTEKDPVTATFTENGVLISTDSCHDGDVIVLPQAHMEVEGYTFIGWATTSVEDATAMPVCFKAGQKYPLLEDTTFYAVYSYMAQDDSEDGGTWTLLTDTSKLEADMKLILAYNAASVVAGDLGSYTYMASLDAQFSDDLSTILELPDGAVILTLGGSEGTWTLANSSGQLLGTASQKLYWNKNNTTWTISVSSDGQAVIVSTSSSDDILQYNKTSPRFKTYKSTSKQQTPQLYYLDTASGSLHYTTGGNYTCTHNWEDVEAVASTCTENGVMAHQVCTLCGAYAVDGVMVSYDSLIMELDPDNHVRTYQDGMEDAGCLTDGFIGATYCCDCDALLKDSEVLTALGHAYGDDGICTRCHHVQFSVATQPTTQKVKSGATATFAVEAAGTDLSYQWQTKTSSSGSWINCTFTGSQTASMSVPATTGRNGYYYRCVITDGEGNVGYTNTVRLYVLGIKTQPTTQKVKAGATATFTVSATGSGKTYQWQTKTSSSGSWKNCTFTGSKTATMSVPATTARNGYYYRCKITDSAGNVVYTNTVRLYVLGIKTQPTTQKVKAGATAKFTVSATGYGLSYQWQTKTSSSGSWKNCTFTGSKTATLSVPATTARNGYYYRCKITDSAGNVVYTNTVRLYVLGIKTQPTSKTVTAGNTAKFTVSATGSSLTYQWQYKTSSGWKNTTLTGAKTNTLSVKGTTARNGMKYRCKITDSAGNVVYTNTVTLTVK